VDRLKWLGWLFRIGVSERKKGRGGAFAIRQVNKARIWSERHR
jgi:hypothetical protein